ncbi:hypothetical protein DFH08DRAFT_854607, partial [Mycena albidolilacea]
MGRGWGCGGLVATRPHILPSTTSRGVLRTPTPSYTRISSQSPHLLLISAIWLRLPIRAYASRSPRPHPGPDPSPPPSLIGRLTPRVHTSTSTCDPSLTHYLYMQHTTSPHARHTYSSASAMDTTIFIPVHATYIHLVFGFTSAISFHSISLVWTSAWAVWGLGFTVGTAQGFMASLHLTEYPQLWSMSITA